MASTSAKWVEIAGQIEAEATGGESLIGVHIDSDAGPVEFKPGTSIKVSGDGTKKVTGLKIGGD